MVLKAKGAEANLYIRDGFLVKERVSKKYRIAELDSRLRRRRTKREARYLKRAADAGLNVPQVVRVDEENSLFEMKLVEGRPLKEVLDVEDAPVAEYGLLIGSSLRRLHDAGIVHNDLTTSNLLVDGAGRLFFIDFGLAFPSNRLEDKAMDLVVFKKGILAAHPLLSRDLWGAVAEGYRPGTDLISRIETIEKRVRYS